MSNTGRGAHRPTPSRRRPTHAPHASSPRRAPRPHTQAGWKTPIWETYKTLVNAGEGKDVEFVEIERFAFYERAKKAFAVVSTGETALYGNL